ncbi:MAG TPA: GDP-mannose 4,6-dehydratase [Longimicrobiales bacterium]|nr:GDP-mannose 4,6-dehydratase [Longimicrobiales bacterium]
MRVLVTGADGFVGQHLVAALMERGHAVTGGIRGASPAPGTLPGEIAAAVAWRDFDLRDSTSVEELVAAADPEAVLHLAGISSVSESWQDPETTFDVNATGALRLLTALRRLPAPAGPRPVLLVSSGEVYGADGTEETPLTEEMPIRPVTPYGASKAAQELIADVLADPSRMRLVQTRSFQQIGPGQRPTFVTVNWARQLLDIRDGAQAPVLRVGNLDIHRDFLDVRDATAAYITLMEDAPSGVFNVCSGRSCSLRRLLQLLQDAVGVSPEIRVAADRLRPAEIRSLVGSPRRLTDATGWTPAIPLEESIRTLVASLDHAPRPA